MKKSNPLTQPVIQQAQPGTQDSRNTNPVMLAQIPLMAIRMELLGPLICQLTQTNLTQSITLQKPVQNARGRNTFGFKKTNYLTFYA